MARARIIRLPYCAVAKKMTSTSAPWRDALPLKISNILAFVLSTSAASVALCRGAGIYTEHESYVTPEAWLFALWPVIHALLGGLCIYQFTARGTGLVKEILGWQMTVLLVLNAISSALASSYSHDVRLAGFAVLFFVAGVANHLYGEMRLTAEPGCWTDYLFVILPVSLFHSLISVLFVVGLFAIFGTDARQNPPTTLTNIAVFVTLFVLENAAAGYVFFENGDIASASVITLSLLAIALHQQTPFIHWSAVYVRYLPACSLSSHLLLLSAPLLRRYIAHCLLPMKRRHH